MLTNLLCCAHVHRLPFDLEIVVLFFAFRQGYFSSIQPYKICNPLIVAVIIGDYSNAGLPSITSATSEYRSIIDAFYRIRQYDVVFATNTDATNGDETICLTHLKHTQLLLQPENNNDNSSHHIYKLKWQEGEIEYFNDQINHQILTNTKNNSNGQLQYDGLIYILSSHGNENKLIYNSDGEDIPLEFIFEEFNNKNCKYLRQRPKIYMFDINRNGSNNSNTSNLSQMATDTTNLNLNLNKGQVGNDDQKVNNNHSTYQTYQKDSHCTKVFINSIEQPVPKSNDKDRRYTNNSILIESVTKVVTDDALFLNHSFNDLLRIIRQQMVKLLHLNENDIDSIVLTDHSTMPFDMEFVGFDCKIESSLNYAENQSVIKFTVCSFMFSLFGVICFSSFLVFSSL